MNCPICNGSMWDNRPKKLEGKFSAASPDFKCKDKNCKGVIWPPKRGDIPVAEIPTPDQSIREHKEIEKVIAASEMIKCNASNNTTQLIISGKAELKDLEAVYERVLTLLKT